LSKILNVASALLFILGIVDVLSGLEHLFLPTDTINSLLVASGVNLTVSQIQDFSPSLLGFIYLKIQMYGGLSLSSGLSTSVIALIPYRKGEKWAWYSVLVIGGIGMFAGLVLTYIGMPSVLPLMLVAVILWIAGLALPAKEILSKPS